MSDSEAQDSMDCSLTTETVPGCDEDSDHSDVDHGLGELAPPQRKVQKVSVRYKTGSKCGFKKDYITKHPWLVSDGTGKGAFCKFCKQFYSGSRGLPKGNDGTFISKPFSKWSKATGSTAKNNKLLKHETSNSHREAVCQAEMNSQVEKRGSVVSQLQSSNEAEKTENLMVLSKYVKVAYWLINMRLLTQQTMKV